MLPCQSKENILEAAYKELQQLETAENSLSPLKQQFDSFGSKISILDVKKEGLNSKILLLLLDLWIEFSDLEL